MPMCGLDKLSEALQIPQVSFALMISVMHYKLNCYEFDSRLDFEDFLWSYH